MQPLCLVQERACPILACTSGTAKLRLFLPCCRRKPSMRNLLRGLKPPAAPSPFESSAEQAVSRNNSVRGGLPKQRVAHCSCHAWQCGGDSCATRPCWCGLRWLDSSDIEALVQRISGKVERQASRLRVSRQSLMMQQTARASQLRAPCRLRPPPERTPLRWERARWARRRAQRARQAQQESAKGTPDRALGWLQSLRPLLDRPLAL